MKFWKLDLPLLAAALALSTAPGAWAQGHLFDKVVVDFPNDIHVNDQILPKGHYELRQMRSTGRASNVMLVMSEGASHFDTNAITIPVVNNNTPNKTFVVVQRVGPDYYLDKVWVSGKDYGYQFPIPADVRSRMKEKAELLTLAADYQAPPPQVAAGPSTAEQEELIRRQQEAARQLTESAQQLQQAAQQQREAAEQQRLAAQQAQQALQAAQEAQARQPAPAPEVAQAPPPKPARIPQTSLGWANYLALSGFAIGLAFFLRRRRRRALLQ